VEEPGGCGGQAGGRDGRWRSPAAARGEWQGGGCVRGRGGAQRRGSEEVGDGGRARSKEAPTVMREQEGEFIGDGRCAVAGGGGVVPDLTGARMQAAAVRRPDLDVGGECDGTTGYSSGA
jgi:hypothetical protein